MVVPAATDHAREQRSRFVPRASMSRTLVLALLCTVATWMDGPSTARAQDTCGDVNGDGNITTVDALTILNVAVGVPITLACPATAAFSAPNAVAGEDGCGDVNGDGNVSPSDALLVLNRSVGFEVEFSCPVTSTARNRVRYLNNLICKGEDFTSILRLPSEDMRWESLSGEFSPYQDYDKPQLGGGWSVTLGDCGSTTFSDLVNLPADALVQIRLELNDFFGFVELNFYNEGPIAFRAGDAVPFAVMRLPAPAGLGVSE